MSCGWESGCRAEAVVTPLQADVSCAVSACAVPSKYRIIYRDCGETEDVLNVVSSMYRCVKCQP